MPAESKPTLEDTKLRHINFFKQAEQYGWTRWAARLLEPLSLVDGSRRNADRTEWERILRDTQDWVPSSVDVNLDCLEIGTAKDLPIEQGAFRKKLMTLHPWRKGPYSVFGTHIDTEWHSDWKWQRIAPHLTPLRGRKVLDVGCGSGYHAWRMWGAGAEAVVAIDPSQLFWIQFQLIQQWIANWIGVQPEYMPNTPVQYLPIPLESMPKHTQAFDTIFSMGVLYHRKSPFEHLDHLRSLLRKGGEVVLETLVVEGDRTTVFVPPGRYAVMNNVWCLPSVEALKLWMERVGFVNVRCVDVNQTSIAEQRNTEWMTWQSLPDFLDPNDSTKTIEGHPAPLRATLIANRP